MDTKQHLAPQLSEATFRTFEPYIHQAVKAWPEETKWSPDSMVNEKTQKVLSPHTFAARMRDSIVSYQRFGWESYIDREKFTQIYGQFAVAYDHDGSVWFRNRGRRGRPIGFAKEAHAQDAGGMSLPTSKWEGWDEDQVKAAVILIHHQRLVGPIIFAGEVPQEFRISHENIYNVAFYFDSTLNQTVLS